ncbi:MAG: dTMP kinase [Chloroflexota bacterium]
MSLFITFEGGEGSGKSSQARTLYRRLTRLEMPALLTYEPGGTALGRRIARWLKWSDMPISPVAELLLFDASRAQLVAEVIRPGLADGKTVICDRYADSTVAYQGDGRGLGLPMVTAVNDAGTDGLKPDLTFLLDIPSRDGLVRKGDDRPDRFEQETLAFHQRVRDGYLKLAAQEPERWMVIDAAQSKEKIAAIIWERVSRLLPRGNGQKG